MVHMSYVPPPAVGPESTRTYRSASRSAAIASAQVARARETEEGVHVGTACVECSAGLAHETSAAARGERGAEMVEFAFVVVLLMALLYGIVSYGLILSAQSTVTQAAADGGRGRHRSRHRRVVHRVATAEAEAGNDIGWMNKGACATSGTTITCNASEAPAPRTPATSASPSRSATTTTPRPAVSLVARHGHRDPVDHFVDGRAPALEPELVAMRTGSSRPRTTRDRPVEPRRTRRDVRPHCHLHGPVMLGRRDGRRPRVHRRHHSAGPGRRRYRSARRGSLHQPGQCVTR